MVELKTVTDPATGPYADAFARGRKGMPGADVAWVDELRVRAMQRFAETGFPTIRNEVWKYTDLRRLARASFAPAPAAPAALPRAQLGPLLVDGAAHCAAFVDGRFAPALSTLGDLPRGVTLRPLGQVLAEAPASIEPYLGRLAPIEESIGLVALNTAMMEDGAVLVLEKGATLKSPLQVVNIASDGAAFAVHPRLLVIALEGSEATLVESFGAVGGASGFTDTVAEIDLGPGARLRHVRLQEEGAGASHIGLARVRLARDAAYNGFVVSAGARLSRTELRIALDGKGAECTLDGITLVRGRQHADITTDVAHASGHARSSQTFKAVLGDQARSVFQGRVFVAKDAQKTDAHQSNRNLLLSRGAHADSKPELIIHADDVKCSHGATVGDLDRDALFYLRARGIDEGTARALLIEAFVQETIEAIPADAVRARVERTVASWLASERRAKEAA